MGYGPCTRGLSHWYSEKERGTIFGVWNTSHNIGGGIAGWLAALCADRWGWPSAFYVPGLIATLGAIYLFWRVRDTPQSQGLPPIEEYKKDYPPDERESHERELSAREMFFTYILPNKLLWVLAIANVFVYIARYAMVDWGPTYLKEVKGASLAEGGFSTLVIEFAGAAGMLTMGWLSDKLGGRRARVSVMAMIPLVLAFGGLIFTGSVLLVDRDIKDPARFVEKLRSGADSVSRELWAQIPDESRLKLAQGSSNPNRQQVLLTEELNTILKGTNSLYEIQRFAGVRLSEETQALLAKSPKKGELVYLHRLLIEDTYPQEISPHHFSLKGLLWINMVIFAVIGFLVYVPVMFSGVMSLDLTTKKAVGTAAGFVGMFGYVGGRMIQGKGLGWVAQHYGWDAGIYMVMGCTVVGIMLLSFLWNVRPRG
jgi:sugar phosphate permease